MEEGKARRIIEALILASPEPISPQRIAVVLGSIKPGDIKKHVGALNELYQQEDHAFEIWEVAGGYQFRTRPDYAAYVQQLHEQRPARLSRAALETIAVIAYRQPLTRAEVEHIRGVDAGAVLRNLIERKLVRIAGHKEVPGRPMLYATTRRFLEVFGLKSLDDLPTLREVEDLVGEDAKLPLPPESTEVAESQEPLTH